MSTNLEKRIKAIESVVLRAPHSISIHAVDHLIAFPDEEMKAGALVRLSQELPEGEVKSKVDGYIDDYLAFLDDVDDSYPSLKVGLSGEIIFALKYSKVKKEGDLRGMKKLLDSAHTSSKSYAEALINYGLQGGDDEYFKKGMGMVNPDDVYKILRGRSPQDRALQLDLAELLLQSEDDKVVLDGIRRMSQSDDVEIYERISIVLQNYQRLNSSSEGKDLLERTIHVAYERFPDKDKFVKDFFDVDIKRAVVIAERLAGEKTTFAEIYEIAELIMNHSREDPIAIFDRAISVEDDYGNIVKVAQRVFSKDVAVRYFEQALQKKAELSEYKNTGDVLLGRKLEDLAGRFYEKSIGEVKSYKKYNDLGERCLEFGSKKLARRFIGEAAERAGTFDQYVNAYNSLLNGLSQDETERIFREGLDRFSDVGSYEFVLGYLEEHYGLQVAGRFASGVEKVSDEVSELCKSYISRLEEVSKKEAERQKKLKGDLDAQRQLRELEREPLRRGLVSVPQSFVSGKLPGDLYEINEESNRKYLSEYLPKYPDSLNDVNYSFKNLSFKK